MKVTDGKLRAQTCIGVVLGSMGKVHGLGTKPPEAYNFPARFTRRHSLTQIQLKNKVQFFPII